MTRYNPYLSRRTALRTAAGTTLVNVAGCLGEDSTSSPNDQEILQRITVEGTALIVKFSSAAQLDHINLIQPNEELFAQREIAAGSQQVSFEIGTSYEPGEYTVVALDGEETLAESSTVVQSEIQIHDVGLYRNDPEKSWDEVYEDAATDRLKNGEAYVTIKNSGSGPEAVTGLIFSGGVPNPVENPRGSGIYETDQVVVAPGETVELFSNSFPFGAESKEGLGCSTDGNSGKFTVTVKTRARGREVSNTFDVQYSGSTEMTDCEVTIKET